VTTVGIIPNPASGKDIRRLVALGLTVDNNEKVNVVRRALLGLQSAGVEKVVFMPDYFGIGRKAMDSTLVEIEASFLEMRVRGTQQDSTDAARIMAEMGVGCIIALGGDGTNRAVSKGCGDVPLVPISTGTNNVFPFMIEGTLAGLAAGVVARRLMPLEDVTMRAKRLEILRDGEIIDIALIDVVVSDDVFVGSRAIWDITKVRTIILSRAEPSNIGLSAVGGNLYCADLDEIHGVHLEVGNGKMHVTAPIAPGLIDQVGIKGYRLLKIGDTVDIKNAPAMLALDGEREVEVQPDEHVSVRLSDRGPLVVNVSRALHEAAHLNAFTSHNGTSPDGRVCLMLENRVCLAPCNLFRSEELEIK
jgi:predicted polyphosphate/ATP-dependent NAD kinase